MQNPFLDSSFEHFPPLTIEDLQPHKKKKKKKSKNKRSNNQHYDNDEQEESIKKSTPKKEQTLIGFDSETTLTTEPSSSEDVDDDDENESTTASASGLSKSSLFSSFSFGVIPNKNSCSSFEEEKFLQFKDKEDSQLLTDEVKLKNEREDERFFKNYTTVRTPQNVKVRKGVCLYNCETDELVKNGNKTTRAMQTDLILPPTITLNFRIDKKGNYNLIYKENEENGKNLNEEDEEDMDEKLVFKNESDFNEDDEDDDESEEYTSLMETPKTSKKLNISNIEEGDDDNDDEIRKVSFSSSLKTPSFKGENNSRSMSKSKSSTKKFRKKNYFSKENKKEEKLSFLSPIRPNFVTPRTKNRKRKLLKKNTTECEDGGENDSDDSDVDLVNLSKDMSKQFEKLFD